MKAFTDKLIVVLGQTASGKSAMAVKLALRLGSGQAKKRFGVNGAEVISADSRQVYKGMNLGTGKITKGEMRGVPHHLLDVASPKTIFTVTRYRKLALKAIDKIFKKRKIPILCGGTAFYIRAVIDGLVIPKVAPDWRLRFSLDQLSSGKLFEKLKKLDPRRAKTIDKANRRRLIRALEIVIKTKKPIPILEKRPLPYPVLILGVKKNPTELKKLIAKRLLKRLKSGMTDEIKKLRQSGVSWKRLEEFGLEYRWIARFLQKKITYEDMVNFLQKDIEHFAKRQMTWFSAHGGSASGGKRDKRIQWVTNYKEAEKLVKRFL